MADSHDTSGVEIWKPVVGYEQFYEVSSHGRVRSKPRTVRNNLGAWLQRSRIMRHSVHGNGRQSVSLRVAGRKRKQAMIHRLVLSAFIGPCPKGMECCHYDGNPRNNQIDNLRWDTAKNNAADKIRHGTQVRGESHPISKLNWQMVREIRARYALGKTQLELTGDFGVGSGTIQAIVEGRNWIEEGMKIVKHASQKGVEKTSAKLTEQDVIDIRRRFAAGASRASLARSFGVSWICIKNVTNRTTWKHVA